ncbi:MAG: peptidylprolyl isomerase [Nitrospinota bacterium]
MRISGAGWILRPSMVLRAVAGPGAAMRKIRPAQKNAAKHLFIRKVFFIIADLDALIEGLPEKIRGMARIRRKDIFDSLLNRRLIFRQAEKLGVGNRKAVWDYVAWAQREIMIRVVMSDLNKKWAPTARELKDEYERNKKKFHQLGKVTASHIMVVSEKEAKELFGKLKNGANFAKLAKKYSMAPERQMGGSLGAMTRGQHRTTGLPAIIEETAFSLKAGSFSGVVRSQFGWHIVYTSQKEKVRQLSFKEVHKSIEESLGKSKRARRLEALLAKLSAEYKVKKYPDRIP